jgi:hypothetical protein
MEQFDKWDWDAKMMNRCFEVFKVVHETLCMFHVGPSIFRVMYTVRRLRFLVPFLKVDSETFMDDYWVRFNGVIG